MPEAEERAERTEKAAVNIYGTALIEPSEYHNIYHSARDQALRYLVKTAIT